MRRFAPALVVAAALVASCGAPSTGDRHDTGVRADVTVDAARDTGTSPDADTDAAPDAPADVARDAERDSAVAGPPYPVVLAHGFFGFESFAGINYIDYFFHVREALAEAGEAQVYTPAVDPFNDSTRRGMQLLAVVERVVAETGRGRVNLVGHSQGGLDARVVAALRPDLVASVTTVSTPHEGTDVSDVVLEVVRDPRFRDLADAVVRLVGAALWDELGARTSVFASLSQFSTEGAAAFNRRYPDAPGVDYYSIAGRTGLNAGLTECLVRDRPAFLARWDAVLDPVDPLLSVPQAILAGALGAPNDGLVGVREARHGRFLGCIPADHLDEIGQLIGDGPGLGNSFEHREFYVDLVRWLRAQGY